MSAAVLNGSHPKAILPPPVTPSLWLDWFASSTPAAGGPLIESSPPLVRSNHKLVGAATGTQSTVTYAITQTNWVETIGCNSDSATGVPSIQFGAVSGGTYNLKFTSTTLDLYTNVTKVLSIPVSSGYHRYGIAAQGSLIQILVDGVPAMVWLIANGESTAGAFTLNLFSTGTNATAYFDYQDLEPQSSDFGPVQISRFIGTNGTAATAYTPDFGPAWTLTFGTSPILNNSTLKGANGAAGTVTFNNTATNWTETFLANQPQTAQNFIVFQFGDYQLFFSGTTTFLKESGSQVGATATTTPGLVLTAVTVQSGVISVWLNGTIAILWNVGAGKTTQGATGFFLSDSALNPNAYFSQSAFLSHASTTFLTNVTASAATVNCNHAALAAAFTGTDGATWPDGQLMFINSGGSNFTVISTMGNTASGVTCMGVVTSGTLANPVAGGSSTIKISNQKNSPDYLGAGPIYKDPNNPTHWLQFSHAEKWPGGSGTGALYWTEIHATWSTDSGATWTDLGPIIQPNYPFNVSDTQIMDVMGGQMLVVGNYFYVYYRNSAVGGTGYTVLSVARCLISDALVAALANTAPVFSSLLYGQWTGNPLGGLSDPIDLQNPYPNSWGDWCYHSGLDLYMRTQNTTMGVTIQASRDALSWTPQILMPTLGTPQYCSAFASAGSNGLRTVNDPVSVYALVGVFWTTTQLQSALLTLTAP